MQKLILSFLCILLIKINAQAMTKEDELLRDAQSHYFSAEYGPALKDCDALLVVSPNNLMVLDLRAAVLWSLYNKLAGKSMGEEFVVKNESSELYQTRMAFFQTVDKGIELSEKLFKVNPNNPELCFNRAMLNGRKGGFLLQRMMKREAEPYVLMDLRMAKRCLILDPKYFVAMFPIGIIQYKLATFSPFFQFLIGLLSRIDEEISFNKNEALKRLLLSVSAMPNDFRVIEARGVYGGVLMKEKRYKEALDYLSPLAEIYPNNPDFKKNVEMCRKSIMLPVMPRRTRLGSFLISNSLFKLDLKFLVKIKMNNLAFLNLFL